MSYLPIIDLSASRAGDAAAVAQTAREIDAVCRRHGFFYVVGHGVPQLLCDQVFAVSRSFFDQPEPIKERSHVRLSRHRRGYEALGHQSLDTGKPADLLEAYNIGLEYDLGRPGGDAVPRRGPNQWPASEVVPDMASIAERYMTELEALSRHLMALMAVGLGLSRDHFESFMTQPAPTLRLLHYPPQPALSDPDQMGCGAHTDWGALTLLAQDMNGGLQVCDAEGRWHDVPPVEGSFVVNLGDMMARWTNDAYRSTLHRVINRVSGRDRYSLPYFFDIDYHSVVQALPGCHDESNPPRYAPVTAGEHHQEKMRQARGGYG